MPKKNRISIDEVMAKRKDSICGDSLVKLMKAPPSFNAEQRTARFVMSAEDPDRYGDVVVQEGLNVEEFSKNPIGLLFHGSRNFPIGTWSDIEKKLGGRPRRTEGTLNFLPEGELDESDKAVALVRNGVMRAVSIGFMPTDAEFIRDDDDNWTGGIKFNAGDLLECSLVNVPAHPRALAKAFGNDRQMLKEVIEETLDNWALTSGGLIVPRAHYEQAYKEVETKTMSTPAPEVSWKKGEVEKPEKAEKSADAAGDMVKIELDVDTAAAEQKLDGFMQKLGKALGMVKEMAGLEQKAPVLVEGGLEKAKALQDKIKNKLVEVDKDLAA